MKITQMPSPSTPLTLADLMNKSPVEANGLPGLIVCTDALKGQSPSLDRALGAMRTEVGGAGPGFVTIQPAEIPLIFRYEKELNLIRTLAGEALKDAAPKAKLAIEALWVVYGAFKLSDQFNRPDRDNLVWAMQLGGFVAGAMGLAGKAYPALKMPDHFANGINYFFKAGGAVAAGKTVPIHELMLSSDARMSIPLKALKVLGVSLDPELSASPAGVVPFGLVRQIKRT